MTRKSTRKTNTSRYFVPVISAIGALAIPAGAGADGTIECVSGGQSVSVPIPADLDRHPFRITRAGRDVTTGTAPAAGATARVELPAAPWSPASPDLFVLEVAGKPGQPPALRRNIGFRTLSATQDWILVNGAPFYVRAFIRGIKSHDHANNARLPGMEFHERQIRVAKDLGFNFVRWHSTVPPEEWLDACDRLGLFNQIEFVPRYSWKGASAK